LFLLHKIKLQGDTDTEGKKMIPENKCFFFKEILLYFLYFDISWFTKHDKKPLTFLALGQQSSP
jgi:hypothetical protein